MVARYGGEDGPLGRPERGVECFRCGSAQALNTCPSGYVCAGECFRDQMSRSAKPRRQPKQAWEQSW